MSVNFNIDLEIMIKEETDILQDIVEDAIKKSVIRYSKIIDKDNLNKTSEVFFTYVLEDIKRFLINNGYVKEFEYCVAYIQMWYKNRLNSYFSLKNPTLTLVELLKCDATQISMCILKSSLYDANHDKLMKKIYEKKKNEYLGI